jgi:hypothetical protein
MEAFSHASSSVVSSENWYTITQTVSAVATCNPSVPSKLTAFCMPVKNSSPLEPRRRTWERP